ncbi:DinB family protein [Thermus aquaticus]|uniref:DinB family protein n=1 Tax=Thermus aquaticus TaxID=271 RepID=A0A0M9AEL0_THEAQ|nr:DinB family protein [Thermus aquaticus]KOX90439.1 DinB family protein [Thermus aquaticus]
MGRATGASLQGPVDENQVVALHDAPEKRYPLGDLLWHASLHEARHGAQVALLLRVLGQEPPALGLFFPEGERRPR